MGTLDPEARRLTHLWRGKKKAEERWKKKSGNKRRRRLFVWSWSYE
jgi:hypothetical protein